MTISCTAPIRSGLCTTVGYSTRRATARTYGYSVNAMSPALWPASTAANMQTSATTFASQQEVNALTSARAARSVNDQPPTIQL